MNAANEDHHIYLGLGSNIKPRENLPRALEQLRQHAVVEAVSLTWETPVVGGKGPDFLNAAVLVRTPLSPEEFKNRVIREIESRLGRVRSENKNAPRTIDLDILIVDGETCDPSIWEQAFLAVPLADLIPNYRNAETGETLEQAAARLSEPLSLEPCPDVLQA